MRGCAECGKDLKARRANRAFCGAACRRVFNNRRANRGSILYDLVVIEDEGGEPGKQATERIAEMVAHWKEEDKRRKRSAMSRYDVFYNSHLMLTVKPR